MGKRVAQRSYGAYKTPPAMFASLCLVQLLPAHVTRAIFLDCDVLVLDDIAKLWSEDLDGFKVGAAIEPAEVLYLPRVRFGSWLWRFHGLLRALEVRSLGSRSRRRWQKDVNYPHLRSLNSGVLVLDVARIRAEEKDLSTKLIQLTVETLRHDLQPFFFTDQDILSLHLNGDFKVLSFKWNFAEMGYARVLHPSSYNAAVAATNIMHYNGPDRPWNNGCARPYTKEWLQTLDRTPWRGWRPTRGSSPARSRHGLLWQLRVAVSIAFCWMSGKILVLARKRDGVFLNTEA